MIAKLLRLPKTLQPLEKLSAFFFYFLLSWETNDKVIKGLHEEKAPGKEDKEQEKSLLLRLKSIE